MHLCWFVATWYIKTIDFLSNKTDLHNITETNVAYGVKHHNHGDSPYQNQAWLYMGLSWSHHFKSFTVTTVTWLIATEYLCHILVIHHIRTKHANTIHHWVQCVYTRLNINNLTKSKTHIDKLTYKYHTLISLR